MTETGEAFDNYFISLPERRGPAENKRDPRSDLTGLCAIFHFCLTGCRPRNLRDSQNRAPHRIPEYSIDKKIEDPIKRSAVVAFFDRAFQTEIDLRFQTTDELMDRLHLLSTDRISEYEDPLAVALRESAVLRRVDRKTQLKEMREASWPAVKMLAEYIQRLTGKLQQAPNFQLGTISDTEIDDLAKRGDTIGINRGFVIKYMNHGTSYRIQYVILAVGPECVVYRRTLRFKAPRTSTTVFDWEEIQRYPGDQHADAVLLENDVEMSCSRAIEALSRDIQSQE